MIVSLIVAGIWTAIAWAHYPPGRPTLFGLDMVEHQAEILASVFLVSFVGAVASLWSARRLFCPLPSFEVNDSRTDAERIDDADAAKFPI